jgi:Tfp pilus assembly protein PilN
MLVAALIVVGLVGWAFAILSSFAVAHGQEDLRAHRLALAFARQSAADEQAAKETALRLLDDLATQRAEDVRALMARLQALEQKYNVTRQLYQDSIAIDGPLASKRVQ